MALWRANDEHTAISSLIAALRAENDELREQVRDLRDDARAIEALARGELGLIEPGETLFIVGDTPGVPTLLLPSAFDDDSRSSAADGR